jgi:hypothetical protein
MEWFKRASGLKLFLAIWLLVLLIPIWRLRATRHWESEQLIGIGPSTTGTPPVELGLKPENRAELIRRFPNAPAVQLLELKKPGEWTPHSPPVTVAPVISQESDKSQAIYYRKVRQANENYFDQYAALTRRYPKALFIRSKWLRDATTGSLLIESDDLQKTYVPMLASGLPAPAPPQPKRISWMTAAQIEAALQSARVGASLEPNNAYWPWMEAIFAFSLRRDDDALEALRKAGKCTQFDDDAMGTAGRNLEMLRRVQLCDTEDEFNAYWELLFPHLSRLRSASRQAMWNARQAYKRGDKARALEIADTLQRAALPIARTRGYWIARRVGEAILSIAWKTALTTAGRTPPEYERDKVARKTYKEQMAQAFAAYAVQSGRRDIGDEALRIESLQRKQFWGFAEKGYIQANEAFHRPEGLLDEQFNKLIIFQWLGSWLLRLSLCGAVVWLASFLISRRAGEMPVPLRRSTAITSAFCVGVSGALLWFALQKNAVPQMNLYSLSYDTPPVNTTIPYWLMFGLLLIWLAPIVLMSASSHLVERWRARHISKLNFWPLVLYTSTIFGFYVVGMALTLPLQDTTTGQFWPLPILLFEACYLAMAYYSVRRVRSGLKASVGLWAGAVALWIAWLLLNATSRDGWANIATFSIEDPNIFLLGIASIILLILGLIFWIHNEGFKKVFYCLFPTALTQRVRIAAAALALFSSLAYITALAAAIPTRQASHKMLERQLQIGEVGLLEEQLKKG